MKTLGDLAQAFARMEDLSRTIDTETAALERPMLPADRADTERRLAKAQLAHEELYNTQLTFQVLPAATPTRKPAAA